MKTSFDEVQCNFNDFFESNEKIRMYKKTRFFLSFLVVNPDLKNINPIKSYEIFPILTPLLNHCATVGSKNGVHHWIQHKFLRRYRGLQI